ncbi:DUF7305 domain-containing protein [Stigmatella aurantiaca]|uniref:Conserved uncharacterized protein n=1 Tax=Stigmatella aurantiaca (strain DW4/3-1) TaxID=378806 RepID=Q090G8_STIAD|nr:polymer-forming cytoskeletal protein [Stigmatella aurantiaca]ADO70807.1 conserved uncharacterized protein [Stigmatella aurantiaca DW4/3-1]EAU66121.1 YapH protein, putative [Stigmatella aurantiaca DW4/3-1]
MSKGLSHRVHGALWVGLLINVWAVGCTVRDPVARVREEDAGPTPGEEDGGPTLPEDWVTYCQGSGPPVLVGHGGTGSVCSAQVAQQAFAHALCTCETLALNAPLRVDGFHSSQGPYTVGERGGALAVNGNLTSDNVVDVGGALSAEGLIRMGFSLSVGGDLHGSGSLMGNGTFTVAQNAQVRGNVEVGSLKVGGRLTVPSGFVLTGPIQAAEVLRQPVEALSPCDCAPAAQVDIAGFVANHERVNHNADIGLEPSALEGFSGSRTLELPCGRFYLNRIEGQGGLTLVAQGRTALFVGEGVRLGEQLAVEVSGPEAELDLFIGGDVEVTGPLLLGGGTRTPRMRVYIAGTGILTLPVDSAIEGHLYAPQVLLRLSGNAEVFGSVFVRRVEASSTALLHHDLDVLNAAGTCVSSSTR